MDAPADAVDPISLELLSSLPYPPHERCVEIAIDLGVGDASAVVVGSDLTKEYVSINADYRS